MAFAVIGTLVFLALFSVGAVLLDSHNAARLDRIARATRPRHGARIIPIAPNRNRLGED